AEGPDLPGEFLWLHFSLSHAASEPWLRRYVTLPDAFYESLHGAVGSTRLKQDADSLLAHIHDVLFDFTFEASAVATTSLCITSRLLVSAHIRPLRSVDKLRAAVQAGQVFRSPIELLSHLLQDQASVLVDIVRKFSTPISDTAALVERVKQLQEELAAIVNEQTNRTLFVLTLVTVLALPINLVAGLFGMNVGGIPLAQHPFGFFLVVAPLLVLTGF